MEMRYMDAEAIEDERQAEVERRFRSLELLDLVRKGDHAGAELVIKMDPDLGFCFQGGTALMHASAAGDVAMVELLMTHGASPSDLGDLGRDALMEAAARCPAGKAAKVIRLLLPHSNPKRRDEEGFSAMMHAARQGHLDAAAALLAVSDLLEVDNRGRDIVDLARGSGCLPVLKLVVDRLAGSPELRRAYEARQEGPGSLVVEMSAISQGEEVGLISADEALAR